MQTPEKAPEKVTHVQEQLHSLQEAVEKKGDVMAHLKMLLEFVKQWKTEHEEFLKANPSATELEKHKNEQDVLQHLLGEAMKQTTIDEQDLLRGIFDNTGALEGKNVNDMIAMLTPEHIQDEILAAGGTSTASANGIETKVQNAFEGLWEQAGLSKKLGAFGIGAAEAWDFLKGWAAELFDGSGIGPLRNIAKNIREDIAIKKAAKENIPEAAIKRGQETWRKEYTEWLKKSSTEENAGPAPDLYTHILTAQEAVTKETASAAATEAEKQQIEKLQKLAETSKPFGPDATIVVKKDGPCSAKRVGSGWEVSLAMAALKEDGGAVKLETNGQNLKRAYELLKTNPNVALITIGEAWEVKKGSAGMLEITADASLDAGKATAIADLKLEGRVISLKALTSGEGAGVTMPFARFEDGTLLINEHVLTTEKARTSLIAAAKDIIPTKKLLQFKNDSWIEYTA